MNKCICSSLTDSKHDTSRKIICGNGETTLEVPYYSILRLLDTVREDEFIFTIEYCPICGHSIKH